MKGRFDPVLGELFNFDEATLTANRSGRLTPVQRQQFTVAAGAYRSNAKVVMILIGVGLVVAFVFASMQSGADRRGQLAMGFGSALVVAGLITMLVRRNYSQADRFETDVPVQAVQGPLAIDEHPFSWSDGAHTVTGWKVTVGDQSWRLLPEYAAAFERGAVYRCYYCDFGAPVLTLLSMERVV